MNEGPYIAEVASLIGDPARANILCALIDGRAHTATELSLVAGIQAPTASAHLAKLVAGGLRTVEKQGRHRYYRLASHEAAEALEALSALAPVAAPRRVRTGPRDAEMRRCRTCYDHLAGQVSVALVSAFETQGWLVAGEADFELTSAGEAGLGGLGLDIAAARGARRRFAARCLDWSERRAHLGGALGAELMRALEAAGWVERVERSRTARVTELGTKALAERLGLDLSEPAAA